MLNYITKIIQFYRGSISYLIMFLSATTSINPFFAINHQLLHLIFLPQKVTSKVGACTQNLNIGGSTLYQLNYTVTCFINRLVYLCLQVNCFINMLVYLCLQVTCFINMFVFCGQAVILEMLNAPPQNCLFLYR